jgi:hypothetical protein
LGAYGLFIYYLLCVSNYYFRIPFTLNNWSLKLSHFFSETLL